MKLDKINFLVSCTHHSTAASRETSDPPLELERTFRHVSILGSSNPMSFRTRKWLLSSLELEAILMLLNNAHHTNSIKMITGCSQNGGFEK